MRSRASLYQAIERLVRLGLVEATETVKVEGYPDRILYGITDAGRQAAREWLPWSAAIMAVAIPLAVAKYRRG